jgi:hypothetical protein
MKPKKILYLLVTGVLLILAACSQTPSNPAGVPNTGNEIQATLQVTPEAVMAAINNLSAQLGIAANQIQVQSVQHMDWPDSCLGLPDSGEACSQVITSGWRINLMVSGQAYEVHTDELGAQIRIMK